MRAVGANDKVEVAVGVGPDQGEVFPVGRALVRGAPSGKDVVNSDNAAGVTAAVASPWAPGRDQDRWGGG